jgi:hypothetical protein
LRLKDGKRKPREREREREREFVDVVAHRGNETIYAEVKGRSNSPHGKGLDTYTASC